MNLEQHKARDDMKVWLGQDEVELLLGNADGTEQYIALGLGARCGLRSHEVLDVAPQHVHDTGKGLILRVHHGKGDQYRETPIPGDLATRIETAHDYRDAPASESILSVTTTRSLRRWVERAAEKCREQTDDDQWRHLSFHDLRATWATSLRSKDVDAMVVCDWGGWNDLETFLDHYRGTSTPEAQLREREKVDWLS